MYNNINAIATAGKTRPVKGTRTDGKKEAAIVKPPIKSDYNSTRAYCKLYRLKAKSYIFLTQSLSSSAFTFPEWHQFEYWANPEVLQYAESLIYGFLAG